MKSDPEEASNPSMNDPMNPQFARQAGLPITGATLFRYRIELFRPDLKLLVLMRAPSP
jgi:hypothetical protein